MLVEVARITDSVNDHEGEAFAPDFLWKEKQYRIMPLHLREFTDQSAEEHIDQYVSVDHQLIECQAKGYPRSKYEYERYDKPDMHLDVYLTNLLTPGVGCETLKYGIATCHKMMCDAEGRTLPDMASIAPVNLKTSACQDLDHERGTHSCRVAVNWLDTPAGVSTFINKLTQGCYSVSCWLAEVRGIVPKSTLCPLKSDYPPLFWLGQHFGAKYKYIFTMQELFYIFRNDVNGLVFAILPLVPFSSQKHIQVVVAKFMEDGG